MTFYLRPIQPVALITIIVEDIVYFLVCKLLISDNFTIIYEVRNRQVTEREREILLLNIVSIT